MKIFAAALLCFLLVQPAIAQDAGLYDSAPKDAAFVRVLNFGGGDEMEFSLNGKESEILSFAAGSVYYPITTASVGIDYRERNVEKDVTPENFYSFINIPGEKGPLFLQDAKLANTAKSIIHFYNLTDHLTLSLKANEGKIAVAMANQNDTGHREINPVPVKFAIYDDKVKIQDCPDVILERGRATTIVAYGSGQDISIISFLSDISMTP